LILILFQSNCNGTGARAQSLLGVRTRTGAAASAFRGGGMIIGDGEKLETVIQEFETNLKLGWLWL
jgi:hypothetical protein